MNSKIEELLDRAISSLRAYIVSGSETILEDVLDSIAELKQFPLRGIYEIKLDEVQSLIADKDFWKARKELEYVSTSGHYNGYTFEDETRDAEGEEDNEPIGPDDISPELWGRDEMDFPLAEDTSLMGIRAMLDKISEEKPDKNDIKEDENYYMPNENDARKKQQQIQKFFREHQFKPFGIFNDNFRRGKWEIQINYITMTFLIFYDNRFITRAKTFKKIDRILHASPDWLRINSQSLEDFDINEDVEFDGSEVKVTENRRIDVAIRQYRRYLRTHGFKSVEHSPYDEYKNENGVTVRLLSTGTVLVGRKNMLATRVYSLHELEDEIKKFSTRVAEESKEAVTEKEDGKYVVSGDNASGHVFIHRIMGRGGILPWVSNIEDATIFDDLGEAKRYAAAHMLMANNVKVEPISNYHIDEAVMDHLVKHREGNGWQNEPNEQIAGWKAVVDDSQGLSKPQDMFNPVKGNDNPMTIAANKKDKELHESIITEDSEISNIQDSLTQKYGEYKKIACNDCGTYPCECEESESGKDSPFSRTDNDHVKLKENLYDGTKDLKDFDAKNKDFSVSAKFDEYADDLTYSDDLDKKQFKEEVLHFLRKNGFVLSSKSLATRTIVWKSKRLGIFLSLKWEIGEWDLFGVSRSGFGKTPIREILTSDAQAVVDFLKNAIKEV